jgi:dTDP-4-dehydrorhamnose reductase
VAEPRVLVTGAGGQLGRALRAVLPGAVFRTREELDVTDAAAVERGIAGIDVVVHAAAFTNVDECERRPGAARAVNDLGTASVAAAARRHGARAILLSTDYVFSGEHPPYAEGDERGPVNAYGRTKAAAEDRLDPARDLVVRTSRVFGDGRNFVRTILAAARDAPPRVVDDQIGRPTAAPALAAAVAHLLRTGAAGTVHVAGDGPPCSWADLADRALACSGSDVRVVRVDSASYAVSAPAPVAPRPPDATLDLERARSLGVPLVDWRTSLDEYVKGLA